MRVKLLHTSYFFKQIRAYNKARTRKVKDRILHQVGAYAELLSQESIICGVLTEGERYATLFFLTQFCEFQGLKAEISKSKISFVEQPGVLEVKECLN